MGSILAQVITSGLITGCVYALIALAIVEVYKSSGAVNFAGGEFVMVGAYLALAMIVSAKLPYTLVLPVVAVATFALGGLFERLAVSRIVRNTRGRQSPLVSIVIATFGFSMMARGLVRTFPYTEEVRSLPPLLNGPPLFFGPVVVVRSDLAIVLITVVLMVFLALFFQYTFIGRALRAVSQNQRAAKLCGIPVARLRSAVWALAGMLGGVAGVLVGPKLLLTTDIGAVLMIALAAAVVGGFANLPGAVIGGLIVGVAQNLIGFAFGSGTIAVAPFLIIICVLVLRPQGLLGGKMQVKKL
jgi:branched-chain amino acid transport system permease protein